MLAPTDPKLSGLPVSKVWGVGRANERKLAQIGVKTVATLQQVEEGWMHREFGIVLLKELKGEACHALVYLIFRSAARPGFGGAK